MKIVNYKQLMEELYGLDEDKRETGLTDRQLMRKKRIESLFRKKKWMDEDGCFLKKMPKYLWDVYK